MEFKGTKGEWRHVIGIALIAVKCGDEQIAVVHGINKYDNAKLIAAAPDLLEALQYLKSHVNLVNLPESVEDKINKAIEKALL